MSAEAPKNPTNIPLSETELARRTEGFKRQIVEIETFYVPTSGPVSKMSEMHRRFVQETFSQSGEEDYRSMCGEYIVHYYPDVDRLTIKMFAEDPTLQQMLDFNKDRLSGKEDPERQLNQEVVIENGTLKYRDLSAEHPVEETNNSLAVELTEEFLRRYEWLRLLPFSGDLQNYRSRFTS